jgi:hypothetical protein
MLPFGDAHARAYQGKIDYSNIPPYRAAASDNTVAYFYEAVGPNALEEKTGIYISTSTLPFFVTSFAVKLRPLFYGTGL